MGPIIYESSPTPAVCWLSWEAAAAAPTSSSSSATLLIKIRVSASFKRAKLHFFFSPTRGGGGGYFDYATLFGGEIFCLVALGHVFSRALEGAQSEGGSRVWVKLIMAENSIAKVCWNSGVTVLLLLDVVVFHDEGNHLEGGIREANKNNLFISSQIMWKSKKIF